METSAGPRIVQDEDRERRVLIPKEQALWLFERFTELGVLNVPAAYRLTAPADPGVLQAAVDELLSRHPVLRTIFPEIDGVPVRRVLEPTHPLVECPVERVEVDSSTLDGQLSLFARRPFDLEGSIPIRVGHFVGEAAGDVLCLVVQHIACDAESFGVLIDELGRFFAAIQNGEPLPADLVDVAPELIEACASPEDIDYWHRRLAGAESAPRHLNIGRSGATRTSYDASLLSVVLSDAAAEGTRTLAKQLGMTPNIVLLTAYGLLLSLSGMGEDVVIGVPVDVRGHAARAVVGYHVNLIALRTPMPATSTFREIARASRDGFLEGLAHAQASLDEVYPGSYESSGQWQNPLFRHMLNYRPSRGPAAGGVFAEASVPVNTGYTRLDLQTTIMASGDDLLVYATYSDELFAREDVQALLDRLDLMLRVCSQMPDMTVADLGILTGRTSALRPVEVPSHEPEAPPVAEDPASDDEPTREATALLVEIWRGLLRSPEVDADSHFFRCGGTSMQAAQLVARIRSATGVRLSLRHVFRAPTPRELAAVLTDQAAALPSQQRVGS